MKQQTYAKTCKCSERRYNDTSVKGGKGTRAGVARKANNLKVVCNGNISYRREQQLPFFFENQGIHKSNSNLYEIECDNEIHSGRRDTHDKSDIKR